MPGEFKAQTLQDFLSDFSAGMMDDIAPALLPKNQLATATNVTVRGTYATHRPAYRKVPLSFPDAATQALFEKYLWQGGAYFHPDNSDGRLLAAVSGNLFQLTMNPDGVSMAGTQVSSPGLTQDPNAVQNWIWQAEKWSIWNDGISNPIFFDGLTCARSTWNVPTGYNTTTTSDFKMPAAGVIIAAVPFADITNLLVGSVITVPNFGLMVVQVITPGVAPAGTVDLLNVTGSPDGQTVASGTTMAWLNVGHQLPPGRSAAYGMGRNWVALIDGKQFVASDLVGGSSGTQANQYRDAVLYITENLFLAGGGNFTVPGSPGDIKAMQFVATLDASLGQGPLQVVCPKSLFSCNAPVDRTTWQNLTNPILTESLITNGGLGPNSTVLANGDLMFRSVDGIRSLILARRDFNTWGNVPVSREVNNILSRDDTALLGFGSAVVFDNRLLMTTMPIQHPQGVYHPGVVAMNFDPISSLRGKAPSVYDSLWTGINVLQMIVGKWGEAERCFAFTLNTIDNTIELYEILKSGQADYDNTEDRILWEFESPIIFNKDINRNRDYLQLQDGEIYVDQVLGRVDFMVYYRPDQWPCWVPWHSWSVCAQQPTTDPKTARYRPQFRPEMGLGEPTVSNCDEINDRPLRNGYYFQVKVVIRGHCRFLGGRFQAITLPQPLFSKQICDPICE